MKIIVPLALVALLGVSGCAGIAALKAFEVGVVEPAVDQGVEDIVSRLCKLPPDVMLRQVKAHGDNVLEAMYLLCPAYRDLMLRGSEVINRRNGLGLPVPMAPTEEIE